VTPDDLKRMVQPCWAHRLILTAESELEGVSVKTVLEQAAASVPVPH
jgi:MoxR-like ATPase